ncbi:MAG: hypothetical protein ABFC90_07315 [Bacteroidales bacterium]|nr:hypothetical protein [Bacteroidales bacterium]
MASGWISIHRAIQEHWVWQNEKYLKWWFSILLNVNYEAKKFPVGTEMFTCNPGQSFRSIEQWTDLFSCSKKTTIKFFNLLLKDEMILTEIVGKGNRRKHLLTVVNWEKYQTTETEVSPSRKPECSVNGNPNVTPNNKENKLNKEIRDIEPKFNFFKSFIELGVDENVASDWLTVRKQKRAANTETAFNAIKREIELSGLSANECIQISVERSWQGFNAEWILNKNKNGQNFKQQPDADNNARKAEIMRRAAEACK